MTPPLLLPTDVPALAAFAEDIAGFTVDAVAERIGGRAVDALDREDPLPALMATREEDRLALLIRLFLLGAALTPEQLRTALPASHMDAREWGIVIGDDAVRAAVDLRPTSIGEADVWLASDLGELATGRTLSADHVLGLGGASVTLVDLTVRTPVHRALDLGTGSGIQSLGLAQHAREVLATDISARALRFGAFNVALNEALAPERRGRVDFAEGSFFDPVEGDFDLIVSNPPFVVSPRNSSLATYTYRDGGYEGDGVVQHLLEQIPRHLRPGGTAQLLANWEVHPGQEWHTRIGEWVRATGLDAWVIQREQVDPAHYVHTWTRDGGLTPDRDPEGYRRVYEEWLTDFDARGVEGIGFGYVTLRRPVTRREPWVRVEEITGTIGGGLGETIAHTLAQVETLAGTEDAELLTWHLEVPGDVTEERYHRPGASDPSVIILRQGGGFARAVHVDTLAAGVVGACDGELSLGRIVEAIASLLDVDAGAVAGDVLPTVRGLIVDGLLVRATTGSDTLI